MRFHLAFTAILLAFLASVTAEDLAFEYSLSMGQLSGGAHELVYYSGDTILSELYWPLDGAIVFSASARAVFPGGFALSLGIDSALSGDTGAMTDRDYLNLPTDGSLTHFSSHETNLDRLLGFSLCLSRRFSSPLHGLASPQRIVFEGALGIRITSTHWTASDGYTQYGPWTGEDWTPWRDNLPREDLSGEVITWEQELVSLFAMITVEVPLGRLFLLRGSILASPLNISHAKDHHLLTRMYFIDRMSGGLLLIPELTLVWIPAPRWEAFAAISWLTLSPLRGSTEIRDEQGYIISGSDGSSGTDMETTTIRMGLTRRLSARP